MESGIGLKLEGGVDVQEGKKGEDLKVGGVWWRESMLAV